MEESLNVCLKSNIDLKEFIGNYNLDFLLKKYSEYSGLLKRGKDYIIAFTTLLSFLIEAENDNIELTSGEFNKKKYLTSVKIYIKNNEVYFINRIGSPGFTFSFNFPTEELAIRWFNTLKNILTTNELNKKLKNGTLVRQSIGYQK